MRQPVRHSFLIFLLSVSMPALAHAQDASPATIAALQAQINSLQQQLNDLRAQKTASSAATTEPAQIQDQRAVADVVATKANNFPATSFPATKPTGTGESVKGGSHIKVTVGGFVAAEAMERSRNQTTDVASSFNNLIPFDNSVNAHQREFRGTVRQSRITLLAQGDINAQTSVAGYVESDFLGAAPTANSTESNSYNPRVRVLYATVDKNDWGLHVLAGQEWSLLTMNKTGITPRQEDIPLTIDAQYVPGFNWTRTPQLRMVEDFDDKKLWAGISVESPQVSFGGSTSVLDSNGIAVPAGVNATNAGNSPLSTASYSSDYAPDIVAKLAADPDWGHFETFGVVRFFHDNVGTTDFHNNSKMGGGVGVGALVPVITGKLDLQANAMIGDGIGRYGSAQLPDFAFTPGGGINPLRETTWLLGAIAHPDPTFDLYLYAGGEMVDRSSETSTAFGYGDYTLNNSGCNTPGSTCPAQTSSIWQVTPGLWKQLYKGDAGTLKVGLQDSLTRRSTFSDASGLGPHAYENVVMTSFRYYPF